MGYEHHVHTRLVIATALLVLLASAARIEPSRGQSIDANRSVAEADRVSSWDEFGMNAVIRGDLPDADIHKAVVQDVIQSAATASYYDQAEISRLKAADLTPAQVHAAESVVGADVPPDAVTDPNPSIDANPDVNLSVSEMSDTSATEPDAEASSSAPAPLIDFSGAFSTDTSTSTEAPSPEATSTSDSGIFNAILEGEDSQPLPSETPAETPTESPADIPPPATP